MAVKDKEVIKHLNIILKNELTAINQYFLHARMLKHMGFMKLADHEYKESIDEMKHADMLVERVLYLGGIPNLQDLGKLMIGETVDEILQCDLKLEQKAHVDLRNAITYCEGIEDYVSADMIHKILDSEEEHQLFIRTQLKLIDTMGLTAYLQTQV
ncbi:MAG: bacterioferritin [Rickettsiales bacterium]|nr:bacterioferritin [Rickettsiales bacterium]